MSNYQYLPLAMIVAFAVVEYFGWTRWSVCRDSQQNKQ